MDTIQQGVIALLKSAIAGKSYILPENFRLEDAAQQIREHHIAALVYDGAIRCGIDKQSTFMQELFQMYWKALVKSEAQMREVKKVQAAFDEQEISYLPLKGCRIKGLYPKPELRPMADADILIRMDEYDRIVPTMRELGFLEGQETDHELVWHSKSLYLELHKRLIPSYNKDFYAYFGEGWQIARVDCGTRYTMTAEDEMVFLFTHFAKHYRDGGIGCRYVVDLWVFRNAHPNMDESYIRSVLRKLYLEEFYDNMLRLIDVWFHDAPTDEKIDYMTAFVFGSGSWGSVESRTLSVTVRDAKHSVLGFSGKLVYAWNTLFPDVATLKGKYTILKKASWLLPFIWIIRPFYKVLFEWRTMDKQKRNMDAVSRKNMKQRRKMLNYVGLDYNF